MWPFPEVTLPQRYFPEPVFVSAENENNVHTSKKDKDRREGKGRRCFLGEGIYLLPCRTGIFSTRMIWRKKMNRITAILYLAQWLIWKNGWSSRLHHTKLTPYQNGFSPKKTFVQIIIAANWLEWHSSMMYTSTNQQRQPLPSALSLSFFYGSTFGLGSRQWRHCI